MKLNSEFLTTATTGASTDAKKEFRAPRQTFALVNEKGMALMTDLEGNDSWYQNDSIVDSALEAVIEKLESIPENTAELIAKPVRILLPKSISGLFSGCFIDYIRTGKTIGGKDIPKETLENMFKAMKLASSRYGNVELVADYDIRKDEREGIVAKAWESFKAEISKATRRGFGAPVSTQQVVQQVAAFDDTELKKYQAKLSQLEDALIDAEDEEEEAKLERKIAKVEKAIARQYDMMKRAGVAPASEATEEPASEATEEPASEATEEPELTADEAALLEGLQ